MSGQCAGVGDLLSEKQRAHVMSSQCAGVGAALRWCGFVGVVFEINNDERFIRQKKKKKRINMCGCRFALVVNARGYSKGRIGVTAFGWPP